MADAAMKRINGMAAVVCQTGTPRSRSIGDTHPGRTSLMRNVETPLWSGLAGRPDARRAEPLSGTRRPKKRTPPRRKASGIHNPADRASGPVERLADVGLVSHPKNAVTVANRGIS